MAATVSEEYLMGIADGRETLKREGADHARDHLANLKDTARTFAAASPVGQYLRGERDFWALQVRKLEARA